MKTKSINHSCLFILVIVLFFSCKKDNPLDEEVNWSPLAHFTAEVTKSINYGETNEGHRVDIYFEGPVSGELINGYMSGIDYYLSRADEPDLINAYANILTNDNALITVHITGYVYDDGRIQDEVVSFQSGDDNYKWLNNTRLTGNGEMTSDITFEVDYYFDDI